MANLNFQQPPRSITSQSLSRGGFGGSSLSGHVTPTSGLFPGSSSSASSAAGAGGGGLAGSFAPQQLSPSRNLPPMAGRSLFGQRAFPDRRSIPGLGNSTPMGGMGTFGLQPGRGAYGSQSAVNSFHSVFASGDEAGGAPPVIDLSEFPSLTSREQGDAVPQPGPMPGKQPYVGMVKQPTAESSEFTMSSEDFPALPGTQGAAAGAGGGGGGPSPGGVGSLPSGEKGAGGVPDLGQEAPPANRAPGAEKSQASKRGIQTSPDGKVTNIPGSMVKDQFGMVGLLTFIRAAETDPNLVSLALGQDLTALGLNLNSPENLYPTFAGPWAENPCRPQDIEFPVPPEYLVNSNIRDKLYHVKLNRYKEDLLFYMFYTNVGDVIQLAAAAELYNRDWRYHLEEKVWITQVSGMAIVEKTTTYERGTYYFFDAQNWRKVAKDFHLEYSKLEGRPHIPPAAAGVGNPSASSAGAPSSAPAALHPAP
ncbi:regulator of gene activity isoform X2 [Bacillus rossius redtenbacheri]|uniref:regulator of gene activity isoform X2 n=1 Tax=Bacillus rossius redtenbacheri TaxID=93214 RepID=UPI002FDD0410